MNNKTLNDPNSALNEVIIEFVNNYSGALADGDVIMKDFAGINTAYLAGLAATPATKWTAPEYGLPVGSTAYSQKILGVVRDRSGNGVAVGATGEAIVRGFHPGVKIASADTTAVGSILVASATIKKAHVVSAGASVGTGATIGNALKVRTAADTVNVTVPTYVDVG